MSAFLTNLTKLTLVAGLAVLTACGGDSNESASSSRVSADCPPIQKGNGVMVSSRYNYGDLQKANQWRTDMFPVSCAGSLADMIPSLPDGFGVAPTTKPFIMTDDHVHLGYGELPEELFLEDGITNYPPNLNLIEFEILRFTDEEMTLVRDWMKANPDNYMTGDVNGQPVHLIGGFGTGRPGKGDRLATSLHAFPGDNIVVRVSHKSLFTQQSGLQLSPVVQRVMGDILDGA